MGYEMGVPIQLQDDDAEDASNTFERMLLIVNRLFENPIMIVALTLGPDEYDELVTA